MVERKFVNEIPIDDHFVVLDILYANRGDGSVRVLHNPRQGEPYIELSYHGDWSSGPFYYFKLHGSVVTTLLQMGFVKGKPAWGYMGYDETSYC